MTDDVTPPEFEALLEHLKQSRGFDFTGYKRLSLRRRIDKRMREVGVDGYDAYVDFLELHPAEFVMLFNAMLINVTSFFRDATTWAILRDEVLPERLKRLDPDAPIRVWSAGCASGEEAYSLAVVLAEILGTDEFVRRVKIYGTDIDDDALQTARQATYSEKDLANVDDDLRTRYFESVGDRGVFRSDLRRSVIFGRLDVLADAPISRLELLACRNTLMYFNSETQTQVIDRFHFALNDGGVLMLGKAETLLSHNERFEPIERRRRIFERIGHRGRERANERSLSSADDRSDSTSRALHSATFAAIPIAGLLFDGEGVLLEANDRARQLLGITARNIGLLLQDLEISYRPMDLRTPLTQAYDERRPKQLTGVPWSVDGASRTFDIDIVPLQDAGQTHGVCIFFHDRTQQRLLEDRLNAAAVELEQAYQELQSTNEELETTNEELQSTIEELETTNEELQSTNEELETMNEELQSTNDELHTVNEELRLRSNEVASLNHSMNAVLASVRSGVVVLDGDRRVRVWSPRARDLWGLHEEEVQGMDFLDLDIGLPVDALAAPLSSVLGGRERQAEAEVTALSRRGRTVTCQVRIGAMAQSGLVDGVIVTMDVSGDTAS